MKLADIARVEYNLPDENILLVLSAYEEEFSLLCKNGIAKEQAEASFRRSVDYLIDGLREYYRSGRILKDRFEAVLRIISKKVASHGKEDATDVPETPLSSDGVEAHQGTVSYRTNDLVVPPDIDTLPTLAYVKGQFIAPATVDLRDYCLPTQNQGEKPWCAAYAATGFSENIMWRKNDIPNILSISPETIYTYAKKHDGMPNADGTTLNAALESLIDQKCFDANQCSVKILRTISNVKYAIHKYGCCVVGMNVTKEWYRCNANKSTISGSKGIEYLGGHAVLACGYLRDGLIIQNSWGPEWGDYGFALITWEEVNREFIYGAVIDNCLYNTHMN